MEGDQRRLKGKGNEEEGEQKELFTTFYKERELGRGGREREDRVGSG